MRLKTIYSIIAAAVLALGSTGLYAQAPQYNVTFLPIPSGQSNCTALNLNNLGAVVGFFGYAYDTNAFLYFNGTMTNLNPLIGGTSSVAEGINDSGKIVGFYNKRDNEPGFGTAFVFSLAEGVTDLTPANVRSAAYAINNAGQIVGELDNNPPICVGNQCAAVFLPNGTMVAISIPPFGEGYGAFASDINDFYASNGIGQVVGLFSTNSTGQAEVFLYPDANGEAKVIPVCSENGSNVYAYCINNAGQIPGYCNNQVGYDRYTDSGFIYNTANGSTYYFGKEEISPSGINDAGWVVGIDHLGSARPNPFLFINGTIYDLTELIVYDHFIPDLQPVAINNKGQIAANSALGALLLTPLETK